MLISEKYKIESDSLNISLYEKAKSKSPATTWRAIAFFSSPQQTLKHLAYLGVMETGMQDLATVAKKLEELYSLIDGLKGLPERVESCRRAEK